jgi:hypothetical protein
MLLSYGPSPWLSCIALPRLCSDPATMDVELFAFVLLPIGVTLLGALLTVVGLKLIDRADRPAGE